MADLGDVVKKWHLWHKELPMVEPHYGEYTTSAVKNHYGRY